ncbi:MAG: glycine zipper domain-containing protein [Nitrospira sp.]|nr:glycine zipper domain-containing protein [Nitrospira sp.]
MKNGVKFLVLFAMAFFLAAPAFAQEMIIYPAKGQSNEQMERDKSECYTWSKGQTGFDPMQVPTATAPPPEKQAGSGGALKGAAAGAVVGGAVGGISSGKVGKGAAYGAGAGALLGGLSQASKKKEDEQRRQQWEQEQAAQYTQRRNNYNRAYGACLEGRGYTVK